MTLEQYIESVNAKYKLGNATEHTFRGLLEQLIESIVPEIRATNEPKRIKCGAPDYILTKKEIEVGYIEAKDIGDKDLAGIKKTGNKEQFERYKSALPNLIFTDYLDFHLYIEGVFITKVAIAEIQNGTIVSLPNNFATFTNLIKDFCSFIGQTIKSSKKLAEMMAGKARLLSDVIELALTNDENNSEDSTLKDQMNAFKEILIHDITPKGFADVYAQTIAYGMFAARLHDPTLPTFSRQEASELIPKSNPFLRKLFGYIAGPDIDDRIKWIVDSLVEIFLACNVAEILKNYGKSTKMEDPIIHFYETFLSEYDPKLRKAKGVWYTPKPVVNFIVRAVDEMLKTEFDLPQGLADNSKTKIKVNLQATDKRFKDNIRTIEEEVHKVQILDPATGTGTFLAEVVKHIHSKFKGQQGVWSNYVETHLLPRLNGFELLMASYAMAHLQMDLLLTETGFKPTKDQRFKIYLTNSLEESHPDTGTLFANWLSSEANEANFIKRDTPVMCIVGNPPYASSSTNKGKWIESLTADYKKELKEKSYNSLSDDYVKFIRLGQHYVDKNGTGILAYISNNSFVDGITHRQMRKSLLESFDKIYILDLHGNTTKKEVCVDGSVDKNVFDIKQGVSINIFIKTGDKKKNELGKIYQYDLQGKRDFKYDFLIENTLKSIEWKTIDIIKPEFLFLQKDNSVKLIYEKGFSINEIFTKSSSGVQTEFDELAIHSTKEKAERTLLDLKNLTEIDFATKYNLQSKINKITIAKNDVLTNKVSIQKIDYKIFNKLFCIYTGKTNGLMGRPRFEMMKNIISKQNYSLCLLRSLIDSTNFSSIFVSRDMVDKNLYGFQTSLFPLYRYPETNGQLSTELNTERIPNLNAEIVNKIGNELNLKFTNEKEKTASNFSPIDILDYIYAVLHSPKYRTKYKDFLKTDFPKIPFPKNDKTFWELVELGSQIREIHLLENPKVEDYVTEFNIDGDCVVEKPFFKEGKVFINETQYFENVPEIAWNFYIGGYQPAQKWLKDRKERKLEFDEIAHYQKIIVALTETDRIMKEINEIEIENI